MNNKLTKSVVGPSLLVLSMAVTGTSLAASDYYEFSTYGGAGYEYDVDSYGNTIYYGGGTAVYSVDVSIIDMSKKDEPRYLADGVTPNPNYQTRTFTNNHAITLTGGPNLKSASIGELWVDANYIYTSALDNDIAAFDKSTGAYVSSMNYVTGLPGTGWGSGNTLLSYGDGQWWAANESSNVYSSSDGSTWNYEFTWPSMNGGHGDGMEWVNGYVFVSDMTSNFIAQWGQGDNSATAAIETGWNEWNRFAYTEAGGTNKYVEGMGFGALGHFWAGSGSYIYELGGGEIQAYIEPGSVPEPGMLLLFGSGLLGLLGLRRRRSV
ncbi:MAG: PEP-CTERM sorting domain-containing protein [Gammaproteobacteria bacterium]|nr:PEP-CTERM sorting domain-containing protein [Gammaproteobacteria bacterium]